MLRSIDASGQFHGALEEMAPSLTIERLKRIQATLGRRVLERDPDNIRSVGFAPAPVASGAPADEFVLPITAQFDVWQKRRDVPGHKRIERLESVRLLDRAARRYDELFLPTDVASLGEVVPTGVRVSTAGDWATSSLVMRWTTVRPIPPLTGEDVDDPRWRWGVLTVSHLFAGEADRDPKPRARLQRNAYCGFGPAEVAGRMAARGRIPGGPDLALLETGLDRLWLSGFLPRVDSERIPPAGEQELLRWITSGTQGSLIAEATHGWRWKIFYPELRIERLGRLKDIVCYEWIPSADQGKDVAIEPFGPGTSGGLMVAGGVPIGIQIAATQPDFRIGYAQAFRASLPWLQAQLRASFLAIVRVVTGTTATL